MTVNVPPMIAAVINKRYCQWADLKEMGMNDLLNLYEVYLVDLYNKIIANKGK